MLTQKTNSMTKAVIFLLLVTGISGGVQAQQAVTNNYHTQQYRFPPANAVPQYKAPSNRGYPATKPALRITSDTASSYPQTSSTYPAYHPNYAPPTQAPARLAVQAPYDTARPYLPTSAPDYTQAPYYSTPYGGNYAYNPYQKSPYNPYNSHYNGSYQRPAYNPYNSPYGRSFAKGPFKKFGAGPFNGNNAPWESWPFGSPDSFWNRKEFPFKNQHPGDWFKPGDPKEGVATMWDDLIAAPDDLGTMPGGWYVPSISVPNPVDLEDQLEKASKEVPDLIRVYRD